MTSIGFIGIGTMGKWMVTNLLKSNYKVKFYDTSTKSYDELISKGGIACYSVEAVCTDVEFLILMLPNSKVVETVLVNEDLAIQYLRKNTIVIDMSSSYVMSTLKLSEQLEKCGLHLVDAPVSGGEIGAKNGSLTIMLGGELEIIKKCTPILSSMGQNIIHVGKVGAGHAVKSINNFLSATTLYATAEAALLAKKLNLDLNIVIDAFNRSSGRSYSTDHKFPNFILNEQYNSNFSLGLMSKDVGLVKDLARELEVPTNLIDIISNIYLSAVKTGAFNQDHTEIVKYLEKITDSKIITGEEQLNGVN